MNEERKLSPLERFRIAIGSHAGISGMTVKIDIGDHDMYVKLGWLDGRIVRIDATVSSLSSTISDSEMDSLEASRYDIVRMWIESECQLASDLLASGVVEVEYLIGWWKARRGYPSGYSYKLKFENDSGSIQPMPVAGPFDAIAKLFEQRIESWRSTMLTNVEEMNTLDGQDTGADAGGGHDERIKE